MWADVDIGKLFGRTRFVASHGIEIEEVKSHGIISGSPYTSSADDVWRSSFGTTLMPNSTQGSSSTQLGLDNRAFREALRVLWNRSTKPLSCG